MTNENDETRLRMKGDDIVSSVSSANAMAVDSNDRAAQELIARLVETHTNRDIEEAQKLAAQRRIEEIASMTSADHTQQAFIAELLERRGGNLTAQARLEAEQEKDADTKRR